MSLTFVQVDININLYQYNIHTAYISVYTLIHHACIMQMYLTKCHWLNKINSRTLFTTRITNNTQLGSRKHRIWLITELRVACKFAHTHIYKLPHIWTFVVITSVCPASLLNICALDLWRLAPPTCGQAPCLPMICPIRLLMMCCAS